MLSYKNWSLDGVRRLTAGIMLSLACGWLLAGILSQTLTGLKKPDLQLLSFIISTGSFQGAILLLIGYFLRDQQLTWSEAFGLHSPRRGRTLLLALAGGIIILFVALEIGMLISEAMTRIGLKPEAQSAVQLMQGPMSFARRVFYGVVTIAVAPAAEELLFRGILYPTIKQLGHPQLALWGTSTLFAIIHMNLAALIPLLFVALILTLLYEETNNLLAPIVAHSFFNAANFAVLMHTDEVNRMINGLYGRI